MNENDVTSKLQELEERISDIEIALNDLLVDSGRVSRGITSCSCGDLEAKITTLNDQLTDCVNTCANNFTELYHIIRPISFENGVLSISPTLSELGD